MQNDQHYFAVPPADYWDSSYLWQYMVYMPLAGLQFKLVREAPNNWLQGMELCNALANVTMKPEVDVGIRFSNIYDDCGVALLQGLLDGYPGSCRPPSKPAKALSRLELPSYHRALRCLPLVNLPTARGVFVFGAHFSQFLEWSRPNRLQLERVSDGPFQRPARPLPRGPAREVAGGDAVTLGQLLHFTANFSGLYEELYKHVDSNKPEALITMSATTVNSEISRLLGICVDVREGMLVSGDLLEEAGFYLGHCKNLTMEVPTISKQDALRILPQSHLVGACWTVEANMILNMDPNWEPSRPMVDRAEYVGC